jgi:hypothetical protein
VVDHRVDIGKLVVRLPLPHGPLALVYLVLDRQKALHLRGPPLTGP